MTILIIIGVIILLVGPFRRPLLRYGRFTIPACAGIVAGWFFGSYLAARLGPAYPYSPYMPVFFAAVFGLGAGEGVKNWIDGTFGRGGGRGA